MVRRRAEVIMNIAIGWRLYSADFSVNARDPAGRAHGSVMLIRDVESRKAMKYMSLEDQEAFVMFVTGRGVDFHSALRDANASALCQKVVT